MAKVTKAAATSFLLWVIKEVPRFRGGVGPFAPEYSFQRLQLSETSAMV
jgi:hypothetical protein